MKRLCGFVVVLVLALLVVGTASGQFGRILSSFSREQPPGETVALYALTDGSAAYVELGRGGMGQYLNLVVTDGGTDDNALQFTVNQTPPDVIRVSANGGVIHAVANWRENNVTQYFRWELDGPQVQSLQEANVVYIPFVVGE